MELTHKDYKYINNTHSADRLPGFVDGTGYNSSADLIAGNVAAQYGITNTTPVGVVGKTSAGNTIYNAGGQSAAGLWVKKALANGGVVTNQSNPNPGEKKPTGEFGDSTHGVQGAHFGFALGGWVGGGAIDAIDKIYNRYSTDNLIGEAGTTNAMAGGINYNMLNTVNAGDVMDKYDNETRVTFWTNPFAGIGSLLGRSQAKKQAQIAQYKSANMANAQTGNALTSSLRLNYNKEHGDSSQLYLYGAKDGKLPKFNEGKKGVDTSILPSAGNYEFAGSKPVYTPFGATYGNIANAKLDTGEVVYKEDPRGNITYASEVDPNKTQTGTDKNYGLLAANDGVFTNQTDRGIPISAADAAKAGDFLLAKYLLGLHLQNIGKTDVDGFYAKHGKLPKYAEGAWANNIISGIGMLSGLGQLLHAALNKPHRPNTYVENPYELESLSTLAGLDVNPYPIMQQLRNAETRANRAIDRSGGLSTAQRGLGRLSALYGTQNNIANTLASIQQQRNQYKANYAQAVLNAGDASRRARMAAKQYDLDYFSKAHAAQLGGMQTGVLNMLAQAQGWYKNDFKRRQFNNTMALYKLEQANTAAANEAMRQYNQLLIDMLKQLYMSEDWWRLYGKQKGWLS